MSRCDNCGKTLTIKENGLSRKLLGKNNTACLCIKCMAQTFNVTEETLNRKAEEFKRSGCVLFIES